MCGIRYLVILWCGITIREVHSDTTNLHASLKVQGMQVQCQATRGHLSIHIMVIMK